MGRGQYTLTDFFRNGSVLIGQKNITVAAWLYLTDNTVDQHIFGSYTSTEDTDWIGLRILGSSGKLQFSSKIGAAVAKKNTSAAPVPLNQWVLVGFMLNSGGNGYVVINGTYGAGTAGFGIPAGMNRSTIGIKDSLTPIDPLLGWIGALGIWWTFNSTVFTEYAQRLDFNHYASALVHEWYCDGEALLPDQVGAADLAEIGIIGERSALADNTGYGLYPDPARPIPPRLARWRPAFTIAARRR